MLRDVIAFAVRVSILFVMGVLYAATPQEARAQPERFVNSLGMEFVRVPASTYTMGSPPDEPGRRGDETAHTVTITRPFYVQTTEVTQGQWWKVMGKSFFSRRRGPPTLPVTKVSWHDARRFLARMNLPEPGWYRLPTEAEWEYVARAGTVTAFPWGDEPDCDRALFGNSRRGDDTCLRTSRTGDPPPDQPVPVGSFAPNAWGLFDLVGNVSEWCDDWYGPYLPGPETDPRGPPSGHERVRRGGSWMTSGPETRPAARASTHPAVRNPMTGFRLVWTGADPDTRQLLHWGEEVERGR